MSHGRAHVGPIVLVQNTRLIFLKTKVTNTKEKQDRPLDRPKSQQTHTNKSELASPNRIAVGGKLNRPVGNAGVGPLGHVVPSSPSGFSRAGPLQECTIRTEPLGFASSAGKEA